MSALKSRSSENESSGVNPVAKGITYGLILGAALSIVFSIALDNPALIGIGAGLGMCVGVAAGSARERHR